MRRRTRALASRRAAPRVVPGGTHRRVRSGGGGPEAFDADDDRGAITGDPVRERVAARRDQGRDRAPWCGAARDRDGARPPPDVRAHGRRRHRRGLGPARRPSDARGRGRREGWDRLRRPVRGRLRRIARGHARPDHHAAGGHARGHPDDRPRRSAGRARGGRSLAPRACAQRQRRTRGQRDHTPRRSHAPAAGARVGCGRERGDRTRVRRGGRRRPPGLRVRADLRRGFAPRGHDDRRFTLDRAGARSGAEHPVPRGAEYP